MTKTMIYKERRAANMQYDTLNIPDFLNRALDTPERATERAALSVNAKPLSTLSPQPRVALDRPLSHINRRPLRGAERDSVALLVIRAIKNGHVTVQRLRKHCQLDTPKLRSALRRAIALGLVELIPGSRSYRAL